MLLPLTALAFGAPGDREVVGWCLSNGLRVMFVEDPGRPEIFFHTMIDGGSGVEEVPGARPPRRTP
ncbi:MAG: hypothetical protein AAF602_14810, partial [Myxococcota bacterium]